MSVRPSPPAAALDERWASARGRARRALDERAGLLLDALGHARGDLVTDDLVAAVGRALQDAEPARLWLAIAVLGGTLPSLGTVTAAHRAARLDGPYAGLAAAGVDRVLDDRSSALPSVRVVVDAILVDVHETAHSRFRTGIQRVTRETTRRWAAEHDLHLVCWDRARPALRPLTAWERGQVLGGGVGASQAGVGEVVVPWRSTYVLPELAIDPRQLDGLRGLLAHAACRAVVVGHDCIPLTMSEVVGGVEMADGFADYLSAVAESDVVAATCSASAQEYAGWRRMLVGTGRSGPDVTVVRLPAEVPEVAAETVERVRMEHRPAGLPSVLVVGSHEPRKNHRSVLHAAELLWREGLPFALTFIGGNAWHSDAFRAELDGLAAAGRPVRAVQAAPDDDLWAAYRVARCTVFPSLNEGFGLPLAESLAVGTPAITSAYGSMAEIAAAGGALLVDPRDPYDLATAMRRVLTDDALHAALAAAARARPERSWDDYAGELWRLVEGAA